MSLRGVTRGLSTLAEVPRDLLLGRYPRFVTGGPLLAGEIPVFVFHDAEPEDFSRKLRHLADNDYRTLSVEEYLAVIRGERAAPARAVLLTFDDGRGSFGSVAAPLLQRHGMKAVVFLVPGRMAAGQEAPDALLGWQQVETLAQTGLFDFQSHTLEHARVHVGPQLEGFATPSSGQGTRAFDQPLVRDGGRDLLGSDVPLGTPLYRSAPRLSERLRFFEDESLRRRSVELVALNGGAAFFERSDWERRLRAALRRSAVHGALERPEQQVQAIERELAESRRLIEARTARPALHLCYPWHVAGPTARRLARETGYVTAFCGKVPGTPITMPGGRLDAIARLGEDYLELLPGQGRATLAEVLRRKWRRRFSAPKE